MSFSPAESKKIVEACLANVSRIAKGKDSVEERMDKLKLQMLLIGEILHGTKKKSKKKSKKRKLKDDDGTSSVEIVPESST